MIIRRFAVVNSHFPTTVLPLKLQTCAFWQQLYIFRSRKRPLSSNNYAYWKRALFGNSSAYSAVRNVRFPVTALHILQLETRAFREQLCIFCNCKHALSTTSLHAMQLQTCAFRQQLCILCSWKSALSSNSSAYSAGGNVRFPATALHILQLEIYSKTPGGRFTGGKEPCRDKLCPFPIMVATNLGSFKNADSRL